METFVSSAKSYGTPLKLTCEDHLAKKIILRDISLFKMKRTVEANHMFPGISAQSQAECRRSFRPMNRTEAAECELSFVGRKIPSDVMIVAVYQCMTSSDTRKQLVHTSKLCVIRMCLGCLFISSFLQDIHRIEIWRPISITIVLDLLASSWRRNTKG